MYREIQEWKKNFRMFTYKHDDDSIPITTFIPFQTKTFPIFSEITGEILEYFFIDYPWKRLSPEYIAAEKMKINAYHDWEHRIGIIGELPSPPDFWLFLRYPNKEWELVDHNAWENLPAQKDPLKVLFWEKMFKRDLIELKNMAIRNKDEQPKQMKKVEFLAPSKPRWEIPVDIREKMQEIDLKDFITHEWNVTNWRLNMCRCQFPWSKDRNPSFCVYPQTNSFYDFSSGRGWSLIDFLIYNRNMDVKQAIDYIKYL